VVPKLSEKIHILSLKILEEDDVAFSLVCRVGNRPGRPTGAYGLVCLSVVWPDLFIKKARLRLFKKSI